jgi:hypothetical protein
VVPIWKKYVVGFPFASTFPFSVTLLCVTLAGAPVVTPGLAALAVAGASSTSASANNMAPRNIVPPGQKLPLSTPDNTAGHRTSRRTT